MTIQPSANFIAIGRNPNIEPAQWPFRRLGVPFSPDGRLLAETTGSGSADQRDKLQMKSETTP